MIRKQKRHALVLSCLAAGVALVLGGCERAEPLPQVEEAPPAADVAPVDESPVPAPPTQSSGPTVLTEIAEPTAPEGTAESGLCSFDKVNGQAIPAGSTFVVADPAALVVAGWVGDKGTMARPQANLRLTQVDGPRSWEITAGPPRGRGDVARHFDNDGMKDAGFEVTVDASALPPGEYGLSLVHDAGGRTMACDKGARIRIEG